MVKELAVVDSHSNRVSSYVFKRPYSWEEVPALNARINQVIDHGCNWNECAVLYSELETVLHREASSSVAVYSFGPQKTQFISGLMDRTVIDITQLGCHSLADIILQGISCTFAFHNKFRHVCALRTAYSLAQWLNVHILNLQYAKYLLSPHIIDVFQMTGLLRRTVFNEETKYVSVYLNENLKPQVKIGTSSGHVVLNDLQWFILVTFKSNISNEVHELGDSRHILSMYCGRYIRITSENTQVYLSKKDWSQPMDLASACPEREVIRSCRLQVELVEWRDKCVESKCFCTPPNTNTIDFDAFLDELTYKNQSCIK